MPAWLENIAVIVIVAACAVASLWHFVRDMRRRRCGFGTNCFQDCVLPGKPHMNRPRRLTFLPAGLLRRRRP